VTSVTATVPERHGRRDRRTDRRHTVA